MKRAFSKDSTSTWNNHDSNPGPPDPGVNYLPLDHNAIIVAVVAVVVVLYCIESISP